MGGRWGRGWIAAMGVIAFAIAGASIPTGSSQAAVVNPRGATNSVLVWRHSAPVTLTIGRSVRGRSLVATRQGSPDAPAVILVIGQMHGDEPRGIDVVRELRTLMFPKDIQLWSISTVNPDGLLAHTRVNAHHVDLNRNFPYLWRANPSSKIYFPGTRPSSEPETRAVITFLDHLRPDLVLSFHQAFRAVDAGPAKTQPWVQLMSASTGLPIKDVPCHGPCSGTMTSWFNDGYAGAAITVELPRRVTLHQAQIYAHAVYRASLALLACRSSTPSPMPSSTSSPSAEPTSTPTTTPTPTPSVTSVPSPGVSSLPCP
jgi:predicted deacylase